MSRSPPAPAESARWGALGPPAAPAWPPAVIDIKKMRGYAAA